MPRRLHKGYTRQADAGKRGSCQVCGAVGRHGWCKVHNPDQAALKREHARRVAERQAAIAKAYGGKLPGASS